MLRPTSKRETAVTIDKAPRKSIRLIFSDMLPGPDGILTFQLTTPKWIMQMGTTKIGTVNIQQNIQQCKLITHLG